MNSSATRATRATHHHIADSTGVLVSCLCVCHCLALPVMLTLTGLSLPETGNARMESGLIAASVVLATASIGLGTWRHRRPGPLLLASLGLALLLIVRPRAAEGTFAEAAALLAGGGLLVTAHLRNRLHMRANACCACETTGAGVVGAPSSPA